jgi:hypothetical protein
MGWFNSIIKFAKVVIKSTDLFIKAIDSKINLAAIFNFKIATLISSSCFRKSNQKIASYSSKY